MHSEINTIYCICNIGIQELLTANFFTTLNKEKKQIKELCSFIAMNVETKRKLYYAMLLFQMDFLPLEKHSKMWYNILLFMDEFCFGLDVPTK